MSSCNRRGFFNISISVDVSACKTLEHEVDVHTVEVNARIVSTVFLLWVRASLSAASRSTRGLKLAGVVGDEAVLKVLFGMLCTGRERRRLRCALARIFADSRRASGVLPVCRCSKSVKRRIHIAPGVEFRGLDVRSPV
eukprot:77126-Rhodomonas_salina.1